MPFLAKFGVEAKDKKAKSAAPAAQSGWTAETLVALVRETAFEVVGSSSLQDDSPLMEAGMDSLSAVEFRNRIVGSLPDVKPAPPTHT